MKRNLLLLFLTVLSLQSWAVQYPNVLYAIGTATSADWETANAHKLYKYETEDNNRLYQGFVNFDTPGGELKFLVTAAFNQGQWGASVAGTSITETTVSTQYENVGSGDTDKKFLFNLETGLYLVTIDLKTEGSETITFKKWNTNSDIYEISKAAHLQAFADCANMFNLYVKAKLTDDITYTDSEYQGQGSMIGCPGHAYKGTFDGQNHTVTIAFNNTSAEETGLFRRLNGGTIKNLKVAGSITTNQKYAGGICSGIWQGGYIQNCESAVTITDSQSAANTHGGILARVNDLTSGRNVYVQNCLFSGSFSAPNCTGCAGIVGLTTNDDNKKDWVHIKNNLVTGTLGFKNENTNGVIVCNNNKGDLANNFYTCSVGDNVCKSNATDASSYKSTGKLCYLLNGTEPQTINWYQTIVGPDTYPYPFDTHKQVYKYSDNVYTNLPVTSGKVQISNADELNTFAAEINSGKNGSMNAELTQDIDMSSIIYTPIGSTTYPYTGHFDGQGHSVKLALDNPSLNYQGLFGVVTDGVYIEKVTVTGSVHGNDYVGGIVGGTNGGSSNASKTNIWYCGNEATIKAEGANAAGIIGVNMDGSASIILTNCYNSGNITGARESGALSGWLGGGWSSVRNCYNTGTVKNGNTASKAFGRNSGCYFKNCYYTTLSGTDNSTENTGNGRPTEVDDEAVGSGELCAKLGYGFRQNLEEDAYPNFNVNHGFVNQISKVGYSTQYNAMSDVTIPVGVKAFAGVKNGDRVTLVPIEGNIKAGVPVVLKASPGLYNFMPTTGAAEPADNDLLGSDGSKAFGDNIYVLANKKSHGIGFYKTEDNGKYVPEGRAYLKNSSGSLVKEAYLFSFDDEETAITNVNGNGNNAAIYNMAGQRISKLQKGINIVNGKKVLF